MTLLHHVSDFFYILLGSHALLRPQGAGQDFMTYSRHSSGREYCTTDYPRKKHSSSNYYSS